MGWLIGEALGIIGSDPVTDSSIAEEIKTILKAKIVGLYVNVKYLKGNLTCIKLECMRGSETEFTFLDTAIEVNYVDRRPNLAPGKPETR